jgi:hypothetical protein
MKVMGMIIAVWVGVSILFGFLFGAIVSKGGKMDKITTKPESPKRSEEVIEALIWILERSEEGAAPGRVCTFEDLEIIQAAIRIVQRKGFNC